ncbi:hypothetical protein AOQ84DRAFT_405454 [Glonium stellatum]|uniref:Infection structure specific protein n=1 Tax=Glonium stellatum TaxID=574774 RepID=A0A8E2F1W4_9PEZI|nr:hypothetical protein AOQ84DRAFT_405454 [Glonium stellatum]
MHVQQLILFSLTAVAALAEPVANRMDRRQYSSVDYNSLLAAASSEMAMLSGMPTLPASVESVLATAVPTSILTDPAAECSALAGKEPDWYKKLPGDVKSALTSYESALSSWAKDHSIYSSGTAVATGLAGCGATSVAAAAATAAGTTGKATGTAAAAATGAQATGTNAAARPTSAVAVGLAGAVGLLGLVVAL